MQRYYAGAIWTNHAFERLDQRGLTQAIAGETFRQPDKQFPGKQVGTTEYIRRYGHSTVTVIAKPNEKGEWLILSCWIDPPLPGTKDAQKQARYRAYQRAGFWGKIWLTIRSQLFGF